LVACSTAESGSCGKNSNRMVQGEVAVYGLIAGGRPENLALGRVALA
jgi:hypothetical protein